MWKKKGGEKNEWGGERGGRMVKYEEKEKGGGRKKWIGERCELKLLKVPKIRNANDRM